MASGVIGGRTGVVASPDVEGAGMMEWQTISGVSPESPEVGGPYVAGLTSWDVDRGSSRIVTIPGAGDPATGAGVGAPGLNMWDDWRDLLNFRGSPMPWLLLFGLVALGFMEVAARARVGPIAASASAG